MAGTLTIATASAAVVPAATQAKARPDTTPTIAVEDRTPAPGQRVVVSGKAQTSYGRPLTLEFRRRAGEPFQPLARTTVGHGDLFKVGRDVPASGTLRVTVIPNGLTEPVVSRVLAVTVTRVPPLRAGGRRLHVRAGQTAVVKGRGAPGRSVRLQVRRSGGWSTLARTAPRGGGRFTLRARTHAAMSAPARIVSGGRSRQLGRLDVYRYAQASWYGPGLYGEHLACGGTLGEGTLGVAHKSLPCGTQVTLRHGGRTVRVPVVDRGPYVGAREYDLTA
ncbi:MAG: septal ring lytic transglycosylase RlpA family protein, partial [Solirubrobacteraceae bacterium]